MVYKRDIDVDIMLKKVKKYGIIKMVLLYTDFQNYIILQKGEMHYGNGN